MPRDPSRQGALAAAWLVASYIPMQPALAWAARVGGVQGASDLDGLARWASTSTVLLAGLLLAALLLADWHQRRGQGTMRRWATGAVAGCAVLVFLAALLTLTQAMLTWATSHAASCAIAVDAAYLASLGSIALVVVAPRDPSLAWPLPS